MITGPFWLAAGAGLGWFASRRIVRSMRAPAARIGKGPGAHLLPEPALGWLLRAHGALGVWMTTDGAGEDGPHMERTVDERLGVDDIAAIDRRLERARDGQQNSGERVDAGMLLFRSAGGVAVAMLLAEAPGEVALRLAEQDLTALLDGVRRRPQLLAIAQAQTQTGSLESLESVGLRLAYQLERVTGGDVVVAARERGPVRIIGLSANADARLKHHLLPDAAPLAQVTTGQIGARRIDDDPFGGSGIDRRARRGPVDLVPIPLGSDIVGAVGIWPVGGEQLSPLVEAEVREVVAACGPRLARAIEADQLRDAATRDALTGLHNRRGLDQAMGKVGVTTGALIYVDLDEFKRLNDVLGHAAGDAALVHVGRILNDQIRGEDLAVRLGGEEFALWLPGSNLELGMKVAERVRLKLGTTEWDWQGKVWPVRASFGVAAVPDTTRRVENLSAQADAALYVAKRSGRDRVEAAGSRGP